MLHLSLIYISVKQTKTFLIVGMRLSRYSIVDDDIEDDEDIYSSGNVYTTSISDSNSSESEFFFQ